MKKRQIINIINFIRGIEPREKVDLTEPVKEQIALMKRHRLKGTFLIQYDALCDPYFTDILRELDPKQFEIGVWFEVVQPLAEKAGLPWTGRFPWDWHAHCGFSVGYTKPERERLIDILFEDFKSVFGYFPRSFGSWAFDAHTLAYANDKYGLDAACNCKDQWGTDGYTLWGGYYGQGYYPSRHNAFCPAQTKENQIDTPVFRMLGSDPIQQYDSGVDISKAASAGVQGVFTLEPVYTHEAGGGIPSWVDWYLKENFNGNCLTFGYAQAGQENSFGWQSMKNGLEYQFAKISEMVAAGELDAETLGDTGRWYKQSFPLTPPSAIAALSDWKDQERRSLWYDCKNYRLNLYAENSRFWIRDIYLFREDYPERYLDKVCAANEMTYDNLPFIDGNRFSGNGIRGGLYIVPDRKSPVQGLPYADLVYREEDGNVLLTLTGTPCGELSLSLTENGFTVRSTAGRFLLLPLYNENADGIPGIRRKTDREIELCHEGYAYCIKLNKGKAVRADSIQSEDNQVSVVLDA